MLSHPDQPPPPALRSLCAVVRYVDPDLLGALTGADPEQIAAFLRAPDFEPAGEPPGALRLAPAARAAELASLRAADPDEELRLHELVFAYYLQLLERAPPDAGDLAAEEACFYHLEALRTALIERRAWARIGRLIAGLRAAQPRLPHHRQLLAIFEGANAIRTQGYAAGEAILSQVIADPAVDGVLQMRALNILAQSHWFQARYDRALELYRRSHAIAIAVGDRTFQAHTSLNMSMVYHEIGYYPQALDLSRQSLTMYEELEDVTHLAHARYEVAKNAMQLGRWGEAEAQFQASAGLYRRLGIEAQLANLNALWAILAHAQGDLATSEALYRQSLAIGASEEHGDTAVLMDSWLLLGLLYQTQSRWDEALAAYQQAEQLAGSRGNDHVQALAAFRRGDLLRLQGQPDVASATYEASLALIERLRGSLTVEEVKLGLLGATQQIYEAAVLLLLEQGRHAEAFAVAERARARAFLDLLAQKSPELYASFDQPVVSLAEVQALLPAGAVLIAYYTTGVLQPGEHLLHQLKQANPQLFRHLISPPKVVIFVVTRAQFEVREARLDPNLLAAGPNELRPAQRWLSERKLRALYDQLVAPVQPLLDGCGQLFLIPHGPLHHVPFLALRAPDGRYLLDADRPPIALAPSASVLVRNCLAPPRAAEGAVLAIGYNDPEAGLAHAEAEALATARLLGGSPWVGPERKSQALVAAAPGLRSLHIAGHAVYLPADPLGSYLSLGEGDRLSARAVMGELSLRPGLVTLSACTSGLAQVVGGDELLGMLRAWLYAGATTVVCAQWEASDIVARLLMEQFYGALGRGAEPGVAFRDAVVAVRHMRGRDLAAVFERWRAADRELASPPALPELTPEQAGLTPYADPVVWASFMVVGRL